MKLTRLRGLYRQMYKLLLTGVVAICTVPAFAQFSLSFKINTIPPGHRFDSCFVAGNFNSWDARKNGSLINDSCNIEIGSLPSGTYQFKFTRGSWLSVECGANGNDVENRQINLVSDTIIECFINGWKDDFGKKEKEHTSSSNVKIIDTAFPMPQLDRTRRIAIYLPPGYKKTRQRYPVIYMQDGQNLFDEYTAAFGEWGVDECADSLIEAGLPPCIIVGIDNGPNRLTEYNPYNFKDFGDGEGDAYLRFLVKSLKPYIDRQYRTLDDKENTIIAGSSMGGLISFYAMLKYPDVFGKGGIFSPAFWTAEEIKDLTETSGKNIKGTLFFYIGAEEGEKYVQDMNEVTDKLGANSNALIYVVTDPSGHHNEQAWSKWFPEFYKWVLAKGFNNVIEVEKN